MPIAFLLNKPNQQSFSSAQPDLYILYHDNLSGQSAGHAAPDEPLKLVPLARNAQPDATLRDVVAEYLRPKSRRTRPAKNAHSQDGAGCDDTLGRKAARVREGTIRRCGCARVPERVGQDHNLKSSLLKMMIRRQNLAQAALLHNDKRNTIRQVIAQPV